jgi:ATP-dependent Clp protease ATP-binding subunit ClpA
MARLIQDQIKRPLAEELLFGKLVGGGNVKVTLAPDSNGLAISCEPASEPQVTA